MTKHAASEVWFLCHTGNSYLLSVFLTRFIPFQGCFEKVEEWLDDNKHMLGTIGMVILVVQVVIFSSILFSFTSIYLYIWLYVFVSICLVTTCLKKKRTLCIQWTFLPPSAFESYEVFAQGACWAPTLSSAFWSCLRESKLPGFVPCRLEQPFEDRTYQDTEYGGPGIESQIKGIVGKSDRYSF